MEYDGESRGLDLLHTNTDIISIEKICKIGNFNIFKKTIFIYLRTNLSKILVDYCVYIIYQKVSPPQETNPFANTLSGQLA